MRRDRYCVPGIHVLHTIEGNRTPQVHGFDYVLSRMEKLLGYGHVPEKW